MPKVLKQYASRRVACTVCGIPIEGYADGDFLNIEVANEAWAVVQGADGEIARAYLEDGYARATLTLLHTSASNDYLSALYRRGRLDPDGGDVGAFEALDPSGSSKGKSPQCFILKMPNLKRGKEIGTVDWVIGLANYTGVIGGSKIIGT